MIGVTLDPITITTLRILGSALIGFATLLWFARNSNTAEFKKGAVYSLFAYFWVSTVLLLIAQLGGLMNAMGWGLVGLHVILSVWFGYFLVK